MTANHQEKNARVLSDRGAAVLMLEGECSGDKLYDRVRDLLAKPEQLERMRAELREMAIDDANERIYNVLCGLVNDAWACGREKPPTGPMLGNLRTQVPFCA